MRKTSESRKQSLVDDVGKSTTRPNSRKGNIRPSDHFQGSAVLMNEVAFKPAKSGKRVNIPTDERDHAEVVGSSLQESNRQSNLDSSAAQAKAKARQQSRSSTSPVDHLKGSYHVSDSTDAFMGRKWKGVIRPEDNLAHDKIHLDGQWSGQDASFASIPVRRHVHDEDSKTPSKAAGQSRPQSAQGYSPATASAASPQRPSTSQRSRARVEADQKHSEFHDEFLNGFLVGSGPNEAPWHTKRKVEQKPTIEAQGPGKLVQNGHGDIMWQSVKGLSHIDRKSSKPLSPQSSISSDGRWMTSSPSPPNKSNGDGTINSDSTKSNISVSSVRIDPSLAGSSIAPLAMATSNMTIADMMSRDRGAIAPWENVRNSWDSVHSRGKKRYEVSTNMPGIRPGTLGSASAPFGVDGEAV